MEELGGDTAGRLGLESEGEADGTELLAVASEE